MSRSAAITVGLAVALGIVLVLALALGEVMIPLEKTLAVLFGGSSDPLWHRVVLLEVRLPRVLLAALGGGGLAIAGAASQGLFRNPMADPGIIGVSAGAGLFAVLALYLVPSSALSWSSLLVPAAAFVGAALATFAVYLIARRASPGRHVSVTLLLLAGVAVSGLASAGTSLVLSLSLAEWEVGREMLKWLMGGLEGRSMQHVLIALVPIAVGSVALLRYARELDALLTGEENASAIGVDVKKMTREVIIFVALVTGAAVAVMGVVGFVGLIVPHLARLVVGSRHRALMPISFLGGALLLTLADLLCRALPATDLRLGVVTAIVGAPFFLWLLVRERAA